MNLALVPAHDLEYLAGITPATGIAVILPTQVERAKSSLPIAARAWTRSIIQ